MSAAPVVAVVVAGGLGSRFGGPVPKQVRSLTGKAVVAVAVESLAAGGCTEAVVVVKDGMHNHFKMALAASPIPVRFVTGGATRQESVRNGLRAIAESPRLSKAGKVLIHDAVRPLVPAYVVKDVIEALGAGAEAVTPSVPVIDTIRCVDSETASHVVDRSTLRAVQTPQGFDRQVITECHDRLAADGLDVTDDVTCCEHYGYRVTLVEGSRMALKITEPLDLDIAETLVKATAGAGHHSGRRVRRAIKGLDPRRSRRHRT
ncbi:2-C-methyl-D-erythritol 4-phosphate cytidylyltransferase [Acidipropionibacterium acidipropionici ATCC 4875]|uniref:2-C-methyl-D-erythritol 4-phosphate cytidylyltransferase n=1 Tax=Acidipropionibacterium acidipropionici (strain ATCC 4875 / DSM 20272 / JCM 6432 / NBRC 12425 / NCIMB 8070 / 4) TaxID=1171373 RepID=K7S254_ACIA4|nr:2-C-methyl-D-erythritol 4-phosphate cytidylyltransferase [Acidipropionibacterium acidipropionici]AFV88667.1 2-C-methyl-D-erythritol 4-phosphate cytidylyltransferase [Acidipropionibacterium acidipropionici ATCC 4875]